MPISESNCPCCGTSCESYRRAQHSYTEYVCPECGPFAISDYIKPYPQKMLSVMHYYLLHKRTNNEKPIFFVKDATSFANDTEANYIDKKMLEHLYPRTLNEKIDMILLNLSTKIKVLGDTFVLPGFDESSKYYSLFMVEDSYSQEPLWQQIDAIIEIMEEYDLLKHVHALGDNENSYTFTATGWNHLSELQEKNKAFPQAFIAMSFAPDMEKARKQIIQSIIDSGYLPMVIDEKEHNNQIVPEIFYEIERSTFVIVDLTHHRNGVYYEAGYAQALDKEVIATCKKSDFAERHFDIAQKNIICWDDEEQLYARLLRRIEATVGKRQ